MLGPDVSPKGSDSDRRRVLVDRLYADPPAPGVVQA